MDTRFNEADLAFRDEVRAFFDEAWTDELKKKVGTTATMKEGMIEWQQRLYEKGWIAPGWPEEHGGTGWSVTQTFIYNSERSACGPQSPVLGTYSRFARLTRVHGFYRQIRNSRNWNTLQNI